jgi:hypothetical protein
MKLSHFLGVATFWQCPFSSSTGEQIYLSPPFLGVATFWQKGQGDTTPKIPRQRYHAKDNMAERRDRTSSHSKHSLSFSSPKKKKIPHLINHEFSI